MIKFSKPLLIASLIAAAFSANAQYGGGGSYSSGSYSDGGSCESGDGSRRSSSLQVVGLT